MFPFCMYKYTPQIINTQVIESNLSCNMNEIYSLYLILLIRLKVKQNCTKYCISTNLYIILSIIA